MPVKPEASHAGHTVGGQCGHWLRRIIHLAIALAPILYYSYGHLIAQHLAISPEQLLLIILVLNIVIELLRLFFKVTLPGHRHYEQRQISAFAWGLTSICCVLLFSPSQAIAVPIIWSCAFADPIMGECRRFFSTAVVVVIGLVTIMSIWLLCYWWLATPWWLGLLVAPIMIAVEWPRWRWVDDNALMQLVPLAIILLLGLWISW